MDRSPTTFTLAVALARALLLQPFTMKPWFVLFTLWALSGIVALRTVYADDESVFEARSANLGD